MAEESEDKLSIEKFALAAAEQHKMRMMIEFRETFRKLGETMYADLQAHASTPEEIERLNSPEFHAEYMKNFMLHAEHKTKQYVEGPHAENRLNDLKMMTEHPQSVTQDMRGRSAEQPDWAASRSMKAVAAIERVRDRVTETARSTASDHADHNQPEKMADRAVERVVVKGQKPQATIEQYERAHPPAKPSLEEDGARVAEIGQIASLSAHIGLRGIPQTAKDLQQVSLDSYGMSIQQHVHDLVKEKGYSFKEATNEVRKQMVADLNTAVDNHAFSAIADFEKDSKNPVKGDISKLLAEMVGNKPGQTYEDAIAKIERAQGVNNAIAQLKKHPELQEYIIANGAEGKELLNAMAEIPMPKPGELPDRSVANIGDVMAQAYKTAKELEKAGALGDDTVASFVKKEKEKAAGKDGAQMRAQSEELAQRGATEHRLNDMEQQLASTLGKEVSDQFKEQRKTMSKDELEKTYKGLFDIKNDAQLRTVVQEMVKGDVPPYQESLALMNRLSDFTTQQFVKAAMDNAKYAGITDPAKQADFAMNKLSDLIQKHQDPTALAQALMDGTKGLKEETGKNYKLFVEIDRDHDGRMTDKEKQAYVAKLDTDKDGIISEAEKTKAGLDDAKFAKLDAMLKQNGGKGLGDIALAMHKGGVSGGTEAKVDTKGTGQHVEGQGKQNVGTQVAANEVGAKR